MPAVDAVLLDVGGVFLLPDPEVMLPAVRAGGANPDIATLDRAHYAAIAAADVAMAESGGQERLMWEAYRRTYARTCGVPGDRMADVMAALVSTFSAAAWTRVVPGSVAALERLAGVGAALGVVSNAAGTIQEMLVTARVCQVGEGEGVPVAVVVDSHVVGVQKPDPRIFEIALGKLGVTAARAVHVGDTVHADVRGAVAAGVRPLHLDPYGDCPSRDGHEHVRDLDDVVRLVSAG
jgi:putative hydrolase of the HAD superfamily